MNATKLEMKKEAIKRFEYYKNLSNYKQGF